MPLLYVLRDNLGLHGPRFGCGLGQCGACTVHIDGAAVRSCITPLTTVNEKQNVVTLEGLGSPQKPHPVQKAFIDEQAAQCGYCINGMVMEFGRPHRASGEIQNSADANRWDVTFMPVDEERKKFVDFGNAYYLLQSTYLVAPGAKPAKIEDVNESGVRVGGVANTATLRAAQRTAPKATFVTVPGVDVAVAAIKAGRSIA